jgi:hypothetical protein
MRRASRLSTLSWVFASRARSTAHQEVLSSPGSPATLSRLRETQASGFASHPFEWFAFVRLLSAPSIRRSQPPERSALGAISQEVCQPAYEGGHQA